MGEANIWQPRTIVEITGDSRQVEQNFISTKNQQLFTLTDFAYATQVGALEVYVAGKRQTKFKDWVEVSSNSFMLSVPLAEDISVSAVGNLAITSAITYPLAMLDNGVWEAGKTFTGYNQFLVYDGVTYIPKKTTPLPYTVGAVPNISEVTAVNFSTADLVAWQSKTVGYALDDLQGFTDNLLAQAELLPSGVPDTSLLSKRMEALHGVFDIYGTLAEIAAGKFPVGKIVSVVDRNKELFKIQTGVGSDGLGIIPAGTNKVGVYQPNFLGYNPKAVGAKWDEVTDDTIPNNYAVVEGTQAGLPINLPAGISITGKITYYENTVMTGAGKYITKFKLKDGGNTDILYSDGCDLLWDTDSEAGTSRVQFRHFSINGNRNRVGNVSGNTIGYGIKLYGHSPIIEHVDIYFTPQAGMRTEWGVGGSLAEGLEGTFDCITIGYCGEESWIFGGPHDSHCNDIKCHTPSQKAAGVYKNLWVKKGNARWSKLHVYSLFYSDQGFPAEALRHAEGLYIQGPYWDAINSVWVQVAAGNEFSMSHIEGGNTNVYNGANNTIIDSTCRIYYPWNGINIINEGSSVVMEPTLGEEFKGIGLPVAKGLIFGSTYGGVSNSEFHLNGGGMDAGWINFDGSAGSNSITVRGYNGTPGNTAYLGTPNATDDVNLYVSGPNLAVLKQQAFQTRSAVAKVVALGGTQGTAQPIDISIATAAITGGVGGTGVKLVNSATAKNGHKIQITDTTGSSKNIYPNEGGNFLGLGPNNPVVLAGLKTVYFTVIDGDAGEWVYSLSV